MYMLSLMTYVVVLLVCLVPYRGLQALDVLVGQQVEAEPGWGGMGLHGCGHRKAGRDAARRHSLVVEQAG